MVFIYVALGVLLLVPVAYADSETQTDWSGGPGVPGPVTIFGADFSFDSATEWYWNPGFLRIGQGQIPGEMNLIQSGFGGARSVVAANINGDTKMDVVCAAYTNTVDIAWFENIDGIGELWTFRAVDSDFNSARDVCAADIDGDNDMDIAGAGDWDHEIAWWENNDGFGTSFTKHVVTSGFTNPYAVHAADFSGDGVIDLIGGAAGQLERVTFWRNQGTGLLWDEIMVGFTSGVRSLHSGDADQDGDLDILYAAWYGNEIGWFENDDGSGSSWTKHVIESGYNHAACVYAQDLNGDGVIDVLGASEEQTDISIWLNSSSTPGQAWTRIILDDDFWGSRSVHAADFDGDCDMDVLGAARFADMLAWWENVDGSGTSWTKHVIEPSLNGALDAWAEDLNQDGYPDPIGCSEYISEVDWWRILDDALSADLYSSILNVGCDPDWDYLDWNASVPSGCYVALQVRSLDDSLQGTWSDSLTSPCSLVGIVQNGDSNIQYRVIFSRPNTGLNPYVSDVTISWNPVSVGDAAEPVPMATDLLPFVPNPTGGKPSVRFTLPETAFVNLSIFDISGRLVEVITTDEYQPGYHALIVDDLAPGIYFCRMATDDLTATQRFVVIE